MSLLRGHQLAIAVVAVALAAVGAVFIFARPTYHPYVIPGKLDNALPFTTVSYTAADARRAFAAEGIQLTERSKSPTSTTIGNRGDILEVDAWGDPDKVKASGFHDYIVLNGQYAHIPRVCGSGTPDAERWRGNIRVVVSCTRAGAASGAWLGRVQRALAHL